MVKGNDVLEHLKMDNGTKTRVITALAMLGVLSPVYMYYPQVFLPLIYLLGGGLSVEAAKTTSSEPVAYCVGVLMLISVIIFQAQLAALWAVVAVTWGVRVIMMLCQYRFKLQKYVLSACLLMDISLFVSCFGAMYQNMPNMLIFIMVLVMGIDSVAYFVGKRFGKRRIAPRISPNKTLEGYLGAFAWLLLMQGIFMIDNNIQILLLTIVFCMVYILAITGDLLVSYQKRILDLKDTGSVLPGHGGLLDRFDSWIYVIPFVFLLANIN